MEREILVFVDRGVNKTSGSAIAYRSAAEEPCTNASYTRSEMELALKLANCPFADVPRGINGEIAHADTFDNDRSRAGIRADYMPAKPPYANFAWVQPCS